MIFNLEVWARASPVCSQLSHKQARSQDSTWSRKEGDTCRECILPCQGWEPLKAARIDPKMLQSGSFPSIWDESWCNLLKLPQNWPIGTFCPIFMFWTKSLRFAGGIVRNKDRSINFDQRKVQVDIFSRDLLFAMLDLFESRHNLCWRIKPCIGRGFTIRVGGY